MEIPLLSIKLLINAGQINIIIFYCIETERNRQIYIDSIRTISSILYRLPITYSKDLNQHIMSLRVDY